MKIDLYLQAARLVRRNTLGGSSHPNNPYLSYFWLGWTNPSKWLRFPFETGVNTGHITAMYISNASVRCSKPHGSSIFDTALHVSANEDGLPQRLSCRVSPYHLPAQGILQPLLAQLTLGTVRSLPWVSPLGPPYKYQSIRRASVPGWHALFGGLGKGKQRIGGATPQGFEVTQVTAGQFRAATSQGSHPGYQMMTCFIHSNYEDFS